MQELPALQRSMMVAKTYAAIRYFFAHWPDANPDFDLEAEFPALMDMALNTPDRFQFGLEMMRFIARLNNSHSWYRDPYLEEVTPKRAYRLKYWHDKWVVFESYVDTLKPGDVITHIDNRPVHEWLKQVRPFMNASSEAIVLERLDRMLLLFVNEKYEVELADGRVVMVDHSTANPPPPIPDQVTTGKWLEEDKIGYIYIPSFNAPHFEEKALAYVEQFKDAESIIFDLRDCPGGSTPVNLVKALMTQPYRYWAEGTPLNFGLPTYHLEHFSQVEALEDYMKGYLDTIKYYFRNPMMLLQAEIYQPENPIFTGNVFLLISSTVGSAAEDFVVPFKTTGRGTLIGQTTFGSTGQPYHMQFDEDIKIAIGTKRAFFPDGSRYEGVGIAPDIEIIPTADDLKAGRDPVLAKALELARQA